MSIPAYVISSTNSKQQDLCKTSVKVTVNRQMAESINTSSSSSNETPPITNSLKPSPDCKRKMSNSETELSHCLATEGATEPLLKQYTCAWHKDGSLLVQGHMYITANYICFYSNILGWETKLAIKCREVIQISKQRTILVFPNAISIATLQHQYFFTSFLHRNNAFKVLQCTWRNSMSGITLTRTELINKLQNNSKNKNRQQTTEDEEEEEDDQLSTGGSFDDITNTDSNSTQRTKSDTRLRHVESAGSTETTDDHLSVREKRSYSDTETDSCLPSHSLSSWSGGEEEREGEGEDIRDTGGGGGGELKRSLSLVRLNSASEGVLEDIDGKRIGGKNDENKQRVRQWDRGHSDSNRRSSWLQSSLSSIGLLSYGQIINGIIIILITILIFSMLILVCKLSQLDPRFRTWLPWQPWCQIICT